MEMFSAPCDQILNFAVLARSEYKTLKKTGLFKSTSRGNYAYSLIDDYIDACLEAWTKYKLNLSHHEYIHESSGLVLIETKLSHAPSSQWMRTVTFLHPDGDKQQDYRSAITYKRRSQLSSLLGLGGTEDDEVILGEQREKEDIIIPKNLTIDDIGLLIKATSNPTVCWKNIQSFNKINELKDLPKDKYESVYRYIKSFK